MENITDLPVNSINPVDFYSTCVSHNKPCSIKGLAKTWPAYKKWAYNDGGMDYLEKKLGKETEVAVYIN